MPTPPIEPQPAAPSEPNNEPNGVLIINKPRGFTSHDVVAKVRKALNTRKVGHLGTLDPQAEGVLPIVVGSATRLLQYFADDKMYHATMALGYETWTLDAEGEVVATLPVPPGLNETRIEEALQGFVGTIEQRVPRHAAVHFKGKKLYHYAHQGIAIAEEDLPVKTIKINHITLLEHQLEAEPPTLHLEVACGSGTYIRSLVRDLAKELGTVGTLTRLVRTAHGYFPLSQAVTLEALCQHPTPRSLVQDALPYLPLPKLVVAQAKDVKLLLNGMPLEATAFSPVPRYANNTVALATTAQGELLAVVEWHNYKFRPNMVVASMQQRVL